GLFFVTHAEKRRLKNKKVSVMYELLEEAEKIGDQQISNVQAVHVGVGGKNNFFIAQPFQVVLDIETAHQIVHFIIAINNVPLEIPYVQRLSFQDENGLGIHIPRADNRTRGRLAL